MFLRENKSQHVKRPWDTRGGLWLLECFFLCRAGSADTRQQTHKHTDTQTDKTLTD